MMDSDRALCTALSFAVEARIRSGTLRDVAAVICMTHTLYRVCWGVYMYANEEGAQVAVFICCTVTATVSHFLKPCGIYCKYDDKFLMLS